MSLFRTSADRFVIEHDTSGNPARGLCDNPEFTAIVFGEGGVTEGDLLAILLARCPGLSISHPGKPFALPRVESDAEESALVPIPESSGEPDAVPVLGLVVV